MYNEKKIGVIIPAGGDGVRVGGNVKKQFIMIEGMPVWAHTVGVFDACDQIDDIVLAVPDEDIHEVEAGVSRFGFRKVRAVVAGGVRRQDSVWNALQVLRAFDPKIILVHDAVRPCVSTSIIINVIAAADQFRAAIPGIGPKDTIKKLNGDSFVSSTPERASLLIAQTPQGFHASILYEAFEKADAEKYLGTDEASLVERLGVRVKIVEGSYQNFKITTSEDLALAEFVLRQNRVKKAP